MFEKTLTDIVKGIRGSKRDTALFISQCIADIKTELHSTDLYVKANALNKLTFLQMMGYSMSYASFATIETMSSPRFAHKRIGYLAACQGFTQETDVILLTTNLLQKELRNSQNQSIYEAGLAINCISNICTHDLARDVLPEVTHLMQHSNPYLRKKAVLCLFKLCTKYPQALRISFEKISSLLLNDPNSSVVSCAVNVVTELSYVNPRNYLHLAPAFFELLTRLQNNWMLIKIVKLMGSLVPEEPRLARKLLEPLAEIVNSTQAKSLLYEAVYTITLCLPYCRKKTDGSMPSNVPKIVALCTSTLQDFLADSDSNLKYLGLVGLYSLKASSPSCLVAQRSLILQCLSNDDVTIRTRALGLLPASRKNLQDLCAQLWNHVKAASGQYKTDLISTILNLCTQDKYALVQDFEWYFDLLIHQLATVVGSVDELGQRLEQQLRNVALRVLPVRPHAVATCVNVLLQQQQQQGGGGSKQLSDCILPACAWIVGEYSQFLKQHQYAPLIVALTTPSRRRSIVSSSTQAIYLQAALKVFAAATTADDDESELQQCVDTLTTNLPVYMQSLDVEVQERAFVGLELLRALDLTSRGTSSSCASGIMSLQEEDNLLGMTGTNKLAAATTSSASFLSKCKQAAPILHQLLTPEPMKPISAKAQRKKRQAPLGKIDIHELNAPAVNWSAFDGMFQDLERLFGGTKKPTMEQVSFTQQRPFTTTKSSTTAISSVSAPPIVPHQGALLDMNINEPRSSTAEQPSSTVALNQPRRPEDAPFYLDSGGVAKSEEASNNNRFGTIQLLDSDEEDDTREEAKRKRRKNKKKKKQAAATTTTATVPVYHDSDDDDDEYTPKKSSVPKGFAGLASVDLTAPVGGEDEEEIMPKRQHRQVPERSAQETEAKTTSKVKNKKKKKGKKTKDGGVGDLLDLGGFSTVANVSNATSQPPRTSDPATPAPAATNSAISTAFDDLLGLEATVAAPLPTTLESLTGLSMPPPVETSTKKSGKKVWMKGALKPGVVDGGIDWNNISVYFKINKPGLTAVDLTVRVQNETNTPLNNVRLVIKTTSQMLVLGNVGASDLLETKNVGPFNYTSSDTPVELKGSLVANEGKIPIKLILPATVHLVPVPMTLDAFQQELSSSQYTSTSTKVSLDKVMDGGKVKIVLESFFRASVVHDDGGSALTLASQSTKSGAKVLVLAKIQSGTIKVDIKSTNVGLCKSLAADVKRLLL